MIYIENKYDANRQQSVAETKGEAMYKFDITERNERRGRGER